MVVPDGVVQHEAGVAGAPRVPDARVRLDHHVRHAEELQPRAQVQRVLEEPNVNDEKLAGRAALQRPYIDNDGSRLYPKVVVISLLE